MKKIARYTSGKRGSMLMLTLIVFMVILILGMTMITSMLYSQGENTMQINEQKAYYAAFSAVEAVKTYFLNPKLDSSIISARDLVGGRYFYNLNENQGIDEDTDVIIEIRDGENVPNESSKKYIIIEATGFCGKEKSTVTARMIQEEQKGKDGLYSGKVVLGANSIAASGTNKKIKIIGNMLIDDINTNGKGIYMGGFDFTEFNEGENGTLFIRSEKSVVLQGNKFKDVFIETKETIDINDNEEIRNIYVNKLDKDNTVVKIHRNKIKGEAQLFINNSQPSILDNQIGGRLIMSAKIVPDWSVQKNGAEEVYIKGAESIGAITGSSEKHIKVLYTDTIDYKIQSHYYIDKTEKINLEFISHYEQEMKNTMAGIEETSKILKEKPLWARPEVSSGLIELQESDVAKDSRNWKFKEYYDSDKKIRLVFPDESVGYDRSKNYYIRYGISNNDQSENDYFVSSDPKYKDDQIFFIAEEAQVINFRKVNSDDKFEALYIYAPSAQCEMPKNFQYFKGSIIVNYLIIGASDITFTFREPKDIEGIGVPGDTESTGSSGSTTYTYHFEEYIESDKK